MFQIVNEVRGNGCENLLAKSTCIKKVKTLKMKITFTFDKVLTLQISMLIRS